jgi:biopolymer transport protein ExbB/TolQ
MPRPQADCATAYRCLHQWLLFAGLLAFGLFVLWQSGLLGILIETDRSRLSLLILAGFVLATAHAGWRARALGREQCLAERLRAHMRDAQRGALEHPTAEAGTADSYAHEHVGFLLQKARDGDARPTQELLLERLNQHIRGGHESGWFVADLMLKLGLLGTVIGFIFMLGSVTAIESVDLQTLQKLLTNMSDGMRIALYTTLAGLTAGMLLGFQYQLLDRAADRLLALIIEISEVHLPRHLDHLFSSGDD